MTRTERHVREVVARLEAEAERVQREIEASVGRLRDEVERLRRKGEADAVSRESQ